MLTKEKLQKKLNPIFARFHAEKVISSQSVDEAILNLYIVGCSRVSIDQIRNEVSIALDHSVWVNMTHIEAEMMIENIIRDDGELLFEKKCA